MSLQSVDGIVAAVSAGKSRLGIVQKVSVNGAASAAGRWHELFTATGVPTAGAFSGTAGVATAMNRSSTGALDISANVSPEVRHVANLGLGSPTATGVPAFAILCDFLLYYPACVVTGTATTLNNATTIPRFTDGVGVQCVIAVQSALGAASPALTLSYTDDQGNTGNSGILTAPAASAPISTLFATGGGPFLPLAAGDRGIRKIDSYTLASGTTGTVSFMLVKPLARVPLLAQYVVSERDLLFQMPSFPVVPDDACLGWLVLAGAAMATGSLFIGHIETIWG